MAKNRRTDPQPTAADLPELLARIEEVATRLTAYIAEAHITIQAVKEAERRLAAAQHNVNAALTEDAKAIAERFLGNALETQVADIIGQFGKLAQGAYDKVQRECETLMAAYLGIERGKVSLPQAMHARRVLAMFADQGRQEAELAEAEADLQAARAPLPREARRSHPSVAANHAGIPPAGVRPVNRGVAPAGWTGQDLGEPS